MTARLTTLCGCRRYVSVERPAPREYRLPIRVPVGFDAGKGALRIEPIVYRTFRLAGFAPSDAAVDADYIEVAE